ncbi:MAG: hypothetical protein HYV38_00750, partial [Candidatus Levybacteria bacterium]|nr:hypothetical protein [Candidatus Levybacteria bacterium]
MTEGARLPLDVQTSAQTVMDQQDRTRAALTEIEATGDLTEFGGKVFHWMILGIDRDDA